MIPAAIFQTCKDPGDLPAVAAPLVEGVRAFCRRYGFEHRLFDDAAMHDFVRAEYPELYGLLSGLRLVEQTDAWRYLVVHRFGGFYLDLDCELTPRFPRVLNRLHAPIVQLERDRWIDISHGGFQLPEMGQCFFALPPRSPILWEVVQEMVRRIQSRPRPWLDTYQDILYTTGPGMFGKVMLSHRRQLQIFRRDALVVHHCMSSWTPDLDRWGRKRLLVRRCLIRYCSV